MSIKILNKMRKVASVRIFKVPERESISSDTNTVTEMMSVKMDNEDRSKVDSKIWEKVIDVDTYPHFVEIFAGLLFVIDTGRIYMILVLPHILTQSRTHG